MPRPGLNRRHFIMSASALAAAHQPPRLQASAKPAQLFPAGIVPGGGRPGTGRPPAPASPIESFWQTCDECSRLGLHYIEMNNTHRKFVEAYDSRLSEFRDEMAKRKLTVLGGAIYSHLHIATMRDELIETHVRLAKFLKATGGKYIDSILAPGEALANGTDEDYRKVDVRTMAANANEIGKRIREETGIINGWHPEQGDIRADLVDRFLDATDPRYYNLLADVGHFFACGVDPMKVYKKYAARLVGTHLRDFQPPPPTASAEPASGPPPRGRMVPFGQGVIPLRQLVDYLLEIKFTGPVMGEGGGNQLMPEYMADKLQLRL